MSVDRLMIAFRNAFDALQQNADVLQNIIKKSESLEEHFIESGKHLNSVERSDRVVVEVKCTYLKIGYVDTAAQEFEAEILIQSKWQEPLLNHFTESDINFFDPSQYWDPRLVVLNLVSDLLLNRKSYTIRLHEPGYDHPLVVQYWKFKGTFQEPLELEQFPFDVQDLTIQLSSDRQSEQIQIIEDEDELSSVNVKMFQDSQEWKIYEHVECVTDIFTREFARYIDHPVLNFQCRVLRKTGCYLWNVVFIVLMIKLLTFATMGINPDIPDRVMLIAAVFLTAVTFKLVASESLPVLSYLTYLDVYILLSLTFLWLQDVECAIVSEMTKKFDMNTVIMYDCYFMGVMFIFLILFHIGFAFYISKTALRRKRTMDKKDILYKTMRSRKALQKKYKHVGDLDQQHFENDAEI